MFFKFLLALVLFAGNTKDYSIEREKTPMIKSLLDADENPPENTAVIIEETVLNPVAAAENAGEPFVIVDDSAESDDILEIPRSYAADSFEPQNASEIFDAQTSAQKTPLVVETRAAESKPEEPSMFTMQGASFQPETTEETMRKSGLAYAAAIILLGSIVFMLILGWFADLLFDSSPWGVVGGIVLGSIIGFIQFFRTTAQILKK
ncbi:MAG TPA: AtpZ/AtpI family protein [Pyrinomonadaceae bacterium]